MEKDVSIRDELDLLTATVERIRNKLDREQVKRFNEYLDNQDFIQMMKISKRTAQTWRETGIIPYSQIGSKFYYKLTDIEKLMERTYVKISRKDS